MSYTRRRLLYAAMFGPLIVPAACSRQPTNKHSAAPLDRVTYLTGLGTFGREAFAWLAAAKGFFREVNIDCIIVPGAAGDSNLKLLAAGQAQFAVIDYAGALVRIGNGRNDFQCVAALTQHTLIGIMTLEHSRISAPADLQGRTVAQASGAVVKTLFPAYARLAGFDPRTVRWIDTTPAELPALLASGRVDAIVISRSGSAGAPSRIRRPVAPTENCPLIGFAPECAPLTSMIRTPPSASR